MRAPDTFKFISVVLLTLCTTKPVPPSASASSAESAVAARRPTVPQTVPRVVLRRPS